MPKPLSMIAALFAFLTAVGCAGPQDDAAQRAKMQALFPPYVVNQRPVGSSQKDAGKKASQVSQLYLQAYRSFPQHSRFQLYHQLAERQEDPLLVLEALAVTAGQTVADIGCGAGFYVPALARLVGPQGRILAIDLQPRAIAFLRARLQEDPSLDPHGNITLIESQPDDAGVAAATLDLALFVHADFYAYSPLLDENRRMLASVYRALKPGGRLLVVQYMGLGRAYGMSGESMRQNLAEQGFQEEQAAFHPEGNTWYVVVNRPPGDPPARAPE